MGQKIDSVYYFYRNRIVDCGKEPIDTKLNPDYVQLTGGQTLLHTLYPDVEYQIVKNYQGSDSQEEIEAYLYPKFDVQTEVSNRINRIPDVLDSYLDQLLTPLNVKKLILRNLSSLDDVNFSEDLKNNLSGLALNIGKFLQTFNSAVEEYTNSLQKSGEEKEVLKAEETFNDKLSKLTQYSELDLLKQTTLLNLEKDYIQHNWFSLVTSKHSYTTWIEEKDLLRLQFILLNWEGDIEIPLINVGSIVLAKEAADNMISKVTNYIFNLDLKVRKIKSAILDAKSKEDLDSIKFDLPDTITISIKS